MPSSQIERKLAAIMFTDIAGYTTLSAKDSTKVSEKYSKTYRRKAWWLMDEGNRRWTTTYF